MNRATFLFSVVYGKITNESKSGYKYISDSSILTKPSIEDPSNIILLSNALSNWLSGISTFLIVPSISVNCSLIKRTFSSAICFLILSFVRFKLMICCLPTALGSFTFLYLYLIHIIPVYKKFYFFIFFIRSSLKLYVTLQK